MLLAVVGLGYVGLPLAAAFSRHYTVIGFDINEKKIQELSVGVDKMGEVKQEELMNSKLIFTSDARRLKEADFICVAVPTPVLKSKMPDFSFLESSSKVIGEHLKKGATVVFESTVYPGATEEICVPDLLTLPPRNSGKTKKPHSVSQMWLVSNKCSQPGVVA